MRAAAADTARGAMSLRASPRDAHRLGRRRSHRPADQPPSRRFNRLGAHAPPSAFNTLAAMNIRDDRRPGPADQARRMAIAMVAAHAIGGLVVFVLLGFVMPVPEEVQDDYGLTLINGVVFAGYLAVVVPIELVLGRRFGEPLL